MNEKERKEQIIVEISICEPSIASIFTSRKKIYMVVSLFKNEYNHEISNNSILTNESLCVFSIHLFNWECNRRLSTWVVNRCVALVSFQLRNITNRVEDEIFILKYHTYSLMLVFMKKQRLFFNFFNSINNIYEESKVSSNIDFVNLLRNF